MDHDLRRRPRAAHRQSGSLAALCQPIRADHGFQGGEGRMSPNTKRVAYFEYLANEAYKEIIGRRADVELTRMEYAGTEADNWKTLDRTHDYQVTAAREHLQIGTASRRERE